MASQDVESNFAKATSITDSGKVAGDGAARMEPEFQDDALRARGEATMTMQDLPNSSAEGSDGSGPGLRDKAAERANSFMYEQKSQLAEGLDALARAARQAADDLEEKEHKNAARYLNTVGEQVESFSDYLRDAGVEEIFQDTKNFVRRRPEIIVGGALLAGFFVARMLKRRNVEDAGHLEID